MPIPKSLFTKKRCKNVVPDLGLPTITIGLFIFFFIKDGKKILSRNMKILINNRRMNTNNPIKIVLKYIPNVLLIILYAVMSLLKYDIFI